MYINEETAQLILDTIAWMNKDWRTHINLTNPEEATPITDEEITTMSRLDFIRFCSQRGIEGVERVVSIDDYR